MKFFFLLLFILVGCQDYNSNSFDRTKYSSGCTGEPGDPNFAAACELTKKYCINCHQGYHNSWAAFTTNQDWINSGVIIKGDANNSEFIQYIFNYGPGGSMPKYGSSLPNDEYAKLVEWIDNIP